MDSFKARLASSITTRFDTVPERQTLAEAAVDEIMVAVRNAIENPKLSPHIDTWIVRTALGKTGTRVVAARIDADGSKSVEMVDRNVEIFVRIYAIERECGAAPHEAEQAAHRVIAGMASVGAIDGKE